MQITYAAELFNKEKRIDGRKFDEYRTIEVETNIIKKAEGSVAVKIGDTEVIAGVKLNTGTPFADTPNEGVLMVGAEFSPIASPEFEAGPPSENAVELARIVDRGLRESHCIDLEKLAITPGEKVWILNVDIHIINNQGNLLDAAMLAAITALTNAKVPKIQDEKVVRGDYEKDVPMNYKPVTVTVCKYSDKYFVDPTVEEEDVVDSKLAIAVRDDDKICAMQKQGRKPLKSEDIEKMIDFAIKKTKELRKFVKQAK